MSLPQQLLCSDPAHNPTSPRYLAKDKSPAFQRYQELTRAAGLSRAFTLSVKLHLYTLLREQHEQGTPGLTAAAIAQQLQLNTQPGFRGVTDWLDILVALGTLQRTGDGPDALYSSSSDADKYLAQQSPEYMGGHAILCHDRTFPQYNFLEHSLRTGVQPDIARQLVVPVLQAFAGVSGTGAGTGGGCASGGDPDAFALGMTGCNRPAFKLLAEKFDFSRYKTLADIGGSAGVLCCAVAHAHSHVSCTTLDLPAVHAAAGQYIAGQGLQDRVKIADIDFFKDPFPKADIITMGMILHDWGPQKKQMLMQKAFDALPPGGAFIALDLIIDDSRRSNVWGLLVSLDMCLEFEGEGAADYTFEEFTSWAKAAGFRSTELIHLIGPNSAAVASTSDATVLLWPTLASAVAQS